MSQSVISMRVVILIFQQIQFLFPNCSITSVNLDMVGLMEMMNMVKMDVVDIWDVLLFRIIYMVDSRHCG